MSECLIQQMQFIENENLYDFLSMMILDFSQLSALHFYVTTEPTTYVANSDEAIAAYKDLRFLSLADSFGDL